MIVKHPTLAGVQYDVPEADAEKWEASGWMPYESSVDVTEIKTGTGETVRTIVTPESDHGCPTCGATGVEPCLTTSGTPTSQWHAKRVA